jgi:hypothetical protein
MRLGEEKLRKYLLFYLETVIMLSTLQNNKKCIQSFVEESGHMKTEKEIRG